MNNLKRVIHRFETLEVETSTGNRFFTCEKGPGMVPSARDSLIFGKWADTGEEDYIKGDWLVNDAVLHLGN